MKFKASILMMIGSLVSQWSVLTTYADVGNAFSDGGSSSSDDSGLFWLIYFLLKSPVGWLIILLTLGFFGTLVWQNYQKIKDSQNGVPPTSEELFKAVFEQSKAIVSAVQQLNGTSSTQPMMSETEVAEYLRTNDPNFSIREFKAYASDAFIKVQEAWESLNWNTIRPFESNELFERHAAQLNEYIQKGWYPHLDGQEIKGVSLVGATKDGRYEYLTVKLAASLLDYTTTEDGKVVAGSLHRREYREYRLIFKRVAGVQTQIQEGNATTNCPNCGAPSQVTSSGQCDYCGSVITTGDYGWVLDEYRAW